MDGFCHNGAVVKHGLGRVQDLLGGLGHDAGNQCRECQDKDDTDKPVLQQRHDAVEGVFGGSLLGVNRSFPVEGNHSFPNVQVSSERGNGFGGGLGSLLSGFLVHQQVFLGHEAPSKGLETGGETGKGSEMGVLHGVENQTGMGPAGQSLDADGGLYFTNSVLEPHQFGLGLDATGHGLDTDGGSHFAGGVLEPYQLGLGLDAAGHGLHLGGGSLFITGFAQCLELLFGRRQPHQRLYTDDRVDSLLGLLLGQVTAVVHLYHESGCICQTPHGSSCRRDVKGVCVVRNCPLRVDLVDESTFLLHFTLDDPSICSL